MKKVYLAGPMTGIECFNFPMFDTFADLYKKMDYEVFSPADHDRRLLGRPDDWRPESEHCEGKWERWSRFAPVGTKELPSLRNMLGADLSWICSQATHIAMLPGWEKSRGANAEHATAVALGLEIHYYPIPNDMIKELRSESRPGLIR